MKVPESLVITKITPSFNTVVTTMEKYTETQISSSGLILSTAKVQGTLKEYQYVVSVGPSVRNCLPGDLVKIDPSGYAQYKQVPVNVSQETETYQKKVVGYAFRTIEIDGEPCLLLRDNDIEYVVNEFTDMTPPQILTNINPQLN